MWLLVVKITEERIIIMFRSIRVFNKNQNQEILYSKFIFNRQIFFDDDDDIIIQKKIIFE